MNRLMKKIQLALFLSLLVTVMLAQVHTAYSTESVVADKALSFITDVIQLDMTKYSAKAEGYSVDYPAKLEGVAQEGITYILEAEESKLDIFFRFTNGTLTYCLLTINEGEVLYAQSSANFVDVTNSFLDNYQTWTDDSIVQVMKDMLNRVDATKDVTTTVDNIELEVVWHGDYPSFAWKYMVNGTEYAKMGFSFDKRGLAFGDSRSLFKIGNTDVTVSQKEAIALALKRIENYSYTVDMGNESIIEVTDFEVSEEKTTAELLTWPREPLTLYPYWNVKLNFDSTYPGFVTGINVGIWANSGEVLFCYPIGWGGDVPVEGPPSEHPTQSENGTTQTLDTCLIAIAAVAMIGIALATVVIKKKHK
jgi:hypothetical protein